MRYRANISSIKSVHKIHFFKFFKFDINNVHLTNKNTICTRVN